MPCAPPALPGLRPLGRCFHFGLPNASAAVRRATLYVNYTQPWFARARVDKNWGGNSVFGDGGADVS